MIAIVTGGGRGIGRAIAIKLAETCSGVAVVARGSVEVAETVDAIERRGGRAMAVIADVSDSVAVLSALQEVETKLGEVDLLVNNAGIGGPFGPLEAADPEQWWRCLEVNLKGPFLCTQAVLPGMLARGAGRIINVASGAGTLALPNMSAYVVSKTALIRMTEVLDVESGCRGVKAFAISPGTVRTAMTESVLNHPEAGKMLPFIQKTFDDGHDISPDICANLVSRLASGECDALSGCFLHIEDDLDALLHREAADAKQVLRIVRQ